MGKLIARASPLKAFLTYSFIPLLGVVVGVFLNNIPLIIGAVALWLLLYFALSLHHSYYYLSADDRVVEWHEGLLNQKVRTISWENVDNISIERSLLDRFLGLSTVKVDSAGSRNIEIIAKDIPYSKALSIYNLYREKIKELREG